MIDVSILQSDGNWEYVFAYADKPELVPGSNCDTSRFTRDDVSEIIALADGENDGDNWLIVVKLKDGRVGFVSAGCDYTGWGCQESGSSKVANTLEQMAILGLSQDDRAKLKLAIDGAMGVERVREIGS
jgi:hypothetical protein